MSREIRRVPLDWEQPRYTGEYRHGQYQPMFNETYAQALAKWDAEKFKWDNDVDGYRTEALKYDPNETFEEWNSEAPDPDYYFPEWPADAVLGWCMYETVSEGTPASPVFETPDGLRLWLIDEGYSPEAAAAFVQRGYTIGSFAMVTDKSGQGHLIDGLEALRLVQPPAPADPE